MAFALSSKISSRAAGASRRPQPAAARRPAVVAKALQFPGLPYPMDAFEPTLSKESFEYHYGKHHKAYYDNLLKQIAGSPAENMTLEEIILDAWNGGSPKPTFNNAAQIWNHTFFWETINPKAPAAPSGKLAEAIDRDFGSLDNFKSEFKTAGATQFGSGWAWLVTDKSGKLSISKTPNAVLPFVEGKTAIATCDVWEHAYYVDYRNRRPDFLTAFVDKLIDWNKVAERYAAATA